MCFFFSPPCAKGVLQTTACPDSRTNISVYYCDDPPHKDFNDPNSLVTEHHPPPPNPGGPATSEPDTEKKTKKKTSHVAFLTEKIAGVKRVLEAARSGRDRIKAWRWRKWLMLPWFHGALVDTRQGESERCVCVCVCGRHLRGERSGRTLTELAGTHVLQHGVCFHFIVTWRADGRVAYG